MNKFYDDINNPKDYLTENKEGKNPLNSQIAKFVWSIGLLVSLTACGGWSWWNNGSETPTEKIDKETINNTVRVIDITTNSVKLINEIHDEDWTKDVEYILIQNWIEYARNYTWVFQNLPENTVFTAYTTAKTLNGITWEYKNVTSPENTFRTLEKFETNIAPIAKVSPNQTITEGQIATLIWSGTDEDGNIMDYEWSTWEKTTTISVNPTETTTYTFRVQDNMWVWSPKVETTVFVNEITPTNTAPEATNDTANTAHNTPVTIDVLTNDKDGNGDKLIIKSVNGTNWTWKIINGKEIEFTPENGFSWKANATYEISDGNGGTDIASVSVEVAEEIPSASWLDIPNQTINDTLHTNTDVITLENVSNYIKNVVNPQITISGDSRFSIKNNNVIYNGWDINWNETITLTLKEEKTWVEKTFQVTINDHS